MSGDIKHRQATLFDGSIEGINFVLYHLDLFIPSRIMCMDDGIKNRNILNNKIKAV